MSKKPLKKKAPAGKAKSKTKRGKVKLDPVTLEVSATRCRRSPTRWPPTCSAPPTT